jgi:hypothetical protein
MRITQIGDYNLAAEHIRCRYVFGQQGTMTGQVGSRARVGFDPVIESFTPAVSSASIRIMQEPSSPLSPGLFAEHVFRIINPLGIRRRLVARRNPADPASDYEAYVYFNTVSQTDEGVWLASFDNPAGVWQSLTDKTGDLLDPLEVTGNVPARPVITILGGQAVKRQRFTWTDRSGHGVSSYLVGVTPAEPHSEHQYRVFHGGLGMEVPFSYEGGRLWFRVDINPDQTVWADVYMGSAIDNQVYSGKLNRAGVTLNAGLVAGQVSSDPDEAGANPIAPVWAWQPAPTVKHARQRPYTFGMVQLGDSPGLELVDRDLTGESVALDDDADALVISTGVEATRIEGLSLRLSAGYRARVDPPSPPDPGAKTRRMRIRIANFVGTALSNTQEEIFCQWTFGFLTYPESFEQPNLPGSYFPPDGSKPQDFKKWTEYYTGLNVISGGSGLYYIDFPPSAFRGQDIPLIQMSTFSYDKLWPSGIRTTQVNAPMPPHLFQADWVDPVTNKPIDMLGLASADVAVETNPEILGRVKASVIYRRREDRTWRVAWTKTVQASVAPGIVDTINDLTVQTPGAIAIGVRLEPASLNATRIDWGTLEVTSTPTIILDGSKTPQVSSSLAINAQQLNGALVNSLSKTQLRFQNTLSDDTGLTIDASTLDIRGLDGQGPYYGAPYPSRGVQLFQLDPGSNLVYASGDLSTADIDLSWRERLAI